MLSVRDKPSEYSMTRWRHPGREIYLGLGRLRPIALYITGNSISHSQPHARSNTSYNDDASLCCNVLSSTLYTLLLISTSARYVSVPTHVISFHTYYRIRQVDGAYGFIALENSMLPGGYSEVITRMRRKPWFVLRRDM